MWVFFVDCIYDQDSARHAVSLPLFSSGRPLECRAQAIEFGGRDRRVSRRCEGPAARVSTPLPGTPHPLPCVEAYYLQQTRFESIAERKLRRRQLTEDGNVEITGRDLRENAGSRRGLLAR
jgi:hypothetical protein